MRRSTVNTAMFFRQHQKRVTMNLQALTVSPEHAIIFENIEHTAHLTEDQDARSFLLHRLEKLVEDDHLAGVVDQMLVSGVRRAGFLCKRQLRNMRLRDIVVKDIPRRQTGTGGSKLRFPLDHSHNHANI